MHTSPRWTALQGVYLTPPGLVYSGPNLTHWHSHSNGLNPTWHGPFVAAALWHAVALNALRSIEYLFDFSFVSASWLFLLFFFFFCSQPFSPRFLDFSLHFLALRVAWPGGQRLPCHVVIQVLWPKVSHSWLVRQGSLFQQTSMAVSGLSGLFSQELYSTKLMKLLPWSAVNCIKGAGNCKIRGKLSVAFFHFAPALHCTV